MLAIENVSFAYGRGRRVLDGVSLRVGAGEFAAVLGANGAGKSSLLKIASGYARPDAKMVVFHGNPTPDQAMAGKTKGLKGIIRHVRTPQWLKDNWR